LGAFFGRLAFGRGAGRGRPRVAGRCWAEIQASNASRVIRIRDRSLTACSSPSAIARRTDVCEIRQAVATSGIVSIAVRSVAGAGGIGDRSWGVIRSVVAVVGVQDVWVTVIELKVL
jgi:hypothetical protein